MKDVIESYIPLPPAKGSGWHQVACKVCNDHSHKGLRAGFKFTDGAVGYKCYNCGISAKYDPDVNVVSVNMQTILRAFGINEIDWQRVVLLNMKQGVDSPPTPAIPRVMLIPPSVINLPSIFYRMEEGDEWGDAAISYLISRGIDPSSQLFYCVKQSQVEADRRWYGRIIIPIYYNNQLIYYQGRDLTQLHQKKYLTPSISKQNILFGYHNIQENSSKPIYVVEGWFDAVLINGVAVFGSEMTDAQIAWLNSSNRPKIVIPDKTGDGWRLASQALQLGWGVSLPAIDNSMGDCKDISDMISVFGKLYTMSVIDKYTILNECVAEVSLHAIYGKPPSRR